MKARICDILISGEISADTVSEVLKYSSSHSIRRVMINSPGGSALDGMALYDLLSGFRNTVGVAIGNCASAALLPLLACRMRYSYQHTIFGVHEPYAVPMENETKQEAREGDMVEKMVQDMVRSITIKHTSKSSFNAAMKKSVLNANDALRFGIIHGIVPYGTKVVS